MKNIKPFISYIIPTFNAEKYLISCLESVLAQDYPKDCYEIIIADGGSSDRTLEILKQFNIKPIYNAKRDSDNGKFLALKKSKGEIIVMLDSDNEIVGKNWLSNMIVPLQEDPEILGVESNYFSKNSFSTINKYATQLIIVDPLARILASKPYKIIQKKNYIVKYFSKNSSPVAGANGFLWRKKFIQKYNNNSLGKFAETNLLGEISRKEEIKIANVKDQGIYHYYCESFVDYFKKRRKIARKFLNREKEKKHLWVYSKGKIWYFLCIIYLATFIGPFFESVYQIIKTRQIAWLLHPFISLITIIIYSYHKIFYRPK
jgi:glycosyltransferase involved in cell wall biosynthesis